MDLQKVCKKNTSSILLSFHIGFSRGRCCKWQCSRECIFLQPQQVPMKQSILHSGARCTIDNMRMKYWGENKMTKNYIPLDLEIDLTNIPPDISISLHYRMASGETNAPKNL